MTKVTIIDYGMGNLLSVVRAAEKCAGEAIITKKPSDISDAGHLILSGVGSFAKGMESLNKLGFSGAIRSHVKAGKPLMGICLGMQFLFAESNEFGKYSGLNFFPDFIYPISSNRPC